MYYNTRSSYKKSINRFGLLFFGLLLLLLLGCTDLTAIILSPGTSEVQIKEGETISFKGEALGGTTFSDDESDSPYGYSWVAEGGSPSTSSEKTVDVTYDYAGVYRVSFTVTDREGDRDTASLWVTVIPGEEESELVAKILSPDTSEIEIVAGDSIEFSATAYGGVAPYNYYWETGGSPDTSWEQNPTITFDDEGSYLVSLTVTDSEGNTDIVYIEVTVTLIEPTPS